MGKPGEQKPAISAPRHSVRKRRVRVLAAYTTVAAFGLLALAVILILSSGSGSAIRGNPHINLDSGLTNGITPDNRAGIEPARFEEQSLKEAARSAGCELRLHLPNEGHKHIPSIASEPGYKTAPPTSGDHIEEQQADGAYSETPPPVSVVHSLEHGRLAIQYRPGLSERAQLELIGLFGNMYGGTLLFPNPHMPYSVAATTWTNLLACSGYQGAPTIVALREFGRATWGKFGGEPLIGLRPGAPTPSSP